VFFDTRLENYAHYCNTLIKLKYYEVAWTKLCDSSLHSSTALRTLMFLPHPQFALFKPVVYASPPSLAFDRTADALFKGAKRPYHTKFVLLPATGSVSAERKKLPQVRELFVWLPLKSGTTYLTQYNLARLLHHLKRTWKLIHSIRHLYPDSPPIHCDPSLNACLNSRACNVDVNLTQLKFSDTKPLIWYWTYWYVQYHTTYQIKWTLFSKIFKCLPSNEKMLNLNSK